MKETERRKRFFRVALGLINRKGFRAMSMRMLAAELECDVSNIYNYVKSKHDILEQLLFEISGKFHEGIANIAASTDRPIDKLKTVISLHVQLTIEHPNQVVLLVDEWRNLRSNQQHQKLEEFIDFRNAYEQKLQGIIAQGIKEGQLNDGNLEFMTNCVLSSIRWLYQWYSPEKMDNNPLELEQLMTNFILNGVASPQYKPIK